MDYQRVKDKAERELSPVIAALGYEVVEVKFNKSGGENKLTFFIHKKGGVTLDDCVKVNDALDAPLEALDITDGAPYSLNVSSPGLDRPIITDRDFERHLGDEVDAKLIKPVDKKYRIKGKLLSYDAENCVIGEKTVARKDIKLLTELINFK